MAARSIASGTVSFGLVAIPVRLYSTGESSSSIRFNMVHKSCGTRLKQRYYCPTDDTYVERDEIAKGYEVTKGQYVLFSPDELKALNPDPTHEIGIQEFVPLAKVDPIYFEKSYYLGPDKGGAKPYRLLSKALSKAKQAAVGRYSARGKTYLVLLRPFEDGLLMQQLRYVEEVRSFDEVPVPEADIQKAEMDLALQLIEQSVSKTFEPQQYEDDQKNRVRELIDRKVQGQELVAEPPEAPQAQIVDLMAALKASLGAASDADADDEGTAPKPARKGPKRAARKPAAQKKTTTTKTSGSTRGRKRAAGGS